MRSVAIIALTAVLLSVAGCGAPSAGRAPQPGGLVHDQVTYDGPSDPKESAEALDYARENIRDQAAFWYEYEDTRPDFAPPTLEAFANESTHALVPVFEYDDLTTSASSIYDVTREKGDEYIFMSFLDGDFVAAADWDRAEPDDPFIDEWVSFYGLGYLGFPEAIETLEEHLGTRELQVRIVAVPRGYWVVGRVKDEERAVFVAHQGDYQDDPRDELYTLQQVLEYGAPHADGN